jgi:hypothetical protein
MKNIFRLFSIITFSLLLLFACSTENSSDVAASTPVYQDLKVTFNKSSGETRAEATFREGDEEGTRLILTGESYLEVLGKEVGYYSNVFNYYYRLDTSEITDIIFNFNKNSESKFLNEIKFADRSDLSMLNALDTIKLDGTSFVAWSGNALGSNESLSFTIYQGTNTGGAGYRSGESLQSVNLGLIIVGGLSEGLAFLHISREIEIDLINSGDGGMDNGRFVITTALEHPIYLTN